MKLRVKYEVTEAGRFLGHLDLTRTIMKILRRADIPVMLTEGFNPHPKLSFAMPLSVGHTSKGEYFEVVLKENISEKEFMNRFNSFVPQAILALEVKKVKDKQESMSSIINCAKYRLVFLYSEYGIIEEAIRTILGKKEIVILKKSKHKIKETDIRPLIYNLEIAETDNHTCTVEALIIHGSKGNLRIQDLLTLFSGYGAAVDEISVERQGLFVKNNGKIQDLMEVLKNVG